jgi:t-SNARE complex subunit (syntaxin)
MKYVHQKLENQVIKTIKANSHKIMVMGVVVGEVVVVVVLMVVVVDPPLLLDQFGLSQFYN